MPEVQTPDPAANPGTQTTTPEPATPETTYTKTQVTEMIRREVAKATASRSDSERALADAQAKLAEYEKQVEEAANAKLSAAQRQEKERKAEQDKWARDLDAAKQLAASERTKRHAILVRAAAAERAASVSARLINPELAPIAQRVVADAVRIVDDGKGGEVAHLVMGEDPNDTEPLTDETWARFRDAKLAPFFAAAGGAGARHGTGTGGGALRPSDLSALPPAERIRQGLTGRR